MHSRKPRGPGPIVLDVGHRIGRGEDGLMTVNNHDQQGKDYRSQPRWSAGKKTEVVLRLLRGESLEELSRELQVEAHRLAAWRDDFLAAGSQGLKGQRSDRSPDDRALRQAERKIGELTMENEVLRAAAEKRGGCRSGRRSGPDSHGAQLWRGGGVPGAGCTPLDRLCPTPAGGSLASQADPGRCHRSATRSWCG
jgi:transposase